MDINSTLALDSYARARPATRPSGESDPAMARLGAAAADFAAEFQAADAVAQSTLTGKSDPQALVEALAQTRLAVETAVTLRDRVVEAYQEILRMPV